MLGNRGVQGPDRLGAFDAGATVEWPGRGVSLRWAVGGLPHWPAWSSPVPTALQAATRGPWAAARRSRPRHRRAAGASRLRRRVHSKSLRLWRSSAGWYSLAVYDRRSGPLKRAPGKVVSRVVCKLGDGLFLPGVVEVAEDTVDDPVDAGRVLEAAHGPGPSAHLTE